MIYDCKSKKIEKISILKLTNDLIYYNLANDLRKMMWH